MQRETLSSVLNSLRKSVIPIYGERETEAITSIVGEHIFGYARFELVMHGKDLISDSVRDQINQITKRLTRGEPVQYILGEVNFYGLKLEIGRDVLIPRPETEELVDWIIRDRNSNKGRLIDLGTGSGCIPLALKKHLPNWEVFGCDISDAALDLAQRNAQKLGVDVGFFRANLLEDTLLLEEDFDLIVSNPPYVCESEKTLMAANVLDFEPHLALFVKDDDPLVFYRRILKLAENHLKAGGEIYFELNERYGDELRNIIQDKGYQNIVVRKDLNDKVRMLKAVKI